MNPIPQSGQVIANLPCRACGYNLRGLPYERDCPECGKAIGWTLNGYLLENADPRWVRKLRAGCARIFIGMIFVILLVPVDWLLVPAMIGENAANVLLGTAATAIASGYWMIAAAEPAIGQTEALLSLRHLLRLLVATIFMLMALWIVLPVWPGAHLQWWPIVGPAIFIGLAPATVPAALRMHWISQRVIEHSVGRSLRQFAVYISIWLGGCGGIVIVSTLLSVDAFVCSALVWFAAGGLFLYLWFLVAALDLHSKIPKPCQHE